MHRRACTLPTALAAFWLNDLHSILQEDPLISRLPALKEFDWLKGMAKGGASELSLYCWGELEGLLLSRHECQTELPWSVPLH